MRTAIRDKKAARESAERMLRWDFDRIVVSHGDVLEHGGPEALREAFAWLRARR
jgi:glyoxylase-like metal-dependent hydrolase (beta-lactamase superfamily II)